MSKRGATDDSPPVTNTLGDLCPLCDGELEMTHDADGAWVMCLCGFEMLVPRGATWAATLIRRMRDHS
jgi:hypothetical protein